MSAQLMTLHLQISVQKKLNYEALYNGRYVKATELWFISDLFREPHFPKQIFFPFRKILLNITEDGGCGLIVLLTRSHASG